MPIAWNSTYRPTKIKLGRWGSPMMRSLVGEVVVERFHGCTLHGELPPCSKHFTLQKWRSNFKEHIQWNICKHKNRTKIRLILAFSRSHSRYQKQISIPSFLVLLKVYHFQLNSWFCAEFVILGLLFCWINCDIFDLSIQLPGFGRSGFPKITQRICCPWL